MCERWVRSHRADKEALPLADRHYNRQKPGTPQFVPPGRCQVFLSEEKRALWITSWPFAQYVKHAWAGAWVNSLFRNEGAGQSSDLITGAILRTLEIWEPPALGIVTFVDPKHVPGIMVRGYRVFGFSYWKAGFKHVGFTKGKLHVWQMLPNEMPRAQSSLATAAPSLPPASAAREADQATDDAAGSRPPSLGSSEPK